jgi:poly(glycerol-phosphate) alpha-glucosyltransferase
MNKAWAIQALTAAEALQIRALGITAPAQIIPNGVDLNCFGRGAPPLHRMLGLAQGERTILSLSRLDPKKGIDILIRGFASFSRNSDGSLFTLVIAGQDSGTGYKAELERIVAKEGVSSKVRFIGEVRNETKYSILLGADAFALISHSEGLPVSVLEAMAAGLPVIITPRCNLPEVVDAGAGFLVRSDPEEVAGALARLFRNEDSTCVSGDAGRRLVAKKFSWTSIASQVIDLYRSATEASI